MDTPSADSAKRVHPDDVLPSRLDLYYGGQWHAPRSGRYVETIDPAKGRAIARVAHADAQDTDAAVVAAHNAFGPWSRLSPLERAGCLRKAAAVLRDNAEALAMLDAVNTGNPVAQMVADAKVAATGIEYFAGLVTELKGPDDPDGTGPFQLHAA
jgi:betaine-aldehyde dehydrogenase